MNTSTARKRMFGFEKMMSEGHIEKDTLNEVPDSKSQAPLEIKALMPIAAIALVLGGLFFHQVSGWIVEKTAAGVGQIGQPSEENAVVAKSLLPEMLRGAVSDGNKAAISYGALLKGIPDPADPSKVQTIHTLVEEILSGRREPDYVPFPPIGSPWPADGPICVKVVGDLTWVGIRLQTRQGDVAWLGVVRQENGKNMIYGVNAQFDNLPTVKEAHIPRVLISAGFAEAANTTEGSSK